MNERSQLGRKGRGGNAAIEFSLLVPWILLLFASVFDFGFYYYALIATENAARAAALRTIHPGLSETKANQFACQLALTEMRSLPNAKANPDGTCPSEVTTTGPATVAVTAVRIPAGVDSPPAPATPIPARRITVRYLTMPMFPLPWVPGRMTISRTVEMRIGEDL